MHRARAKQIYSARVARDLDHEETFEDAWLVTTTSDKRRSGTFGPGSGVLLVVLTTMFVMFLPSNSPQPRALPSYLPPASGLGSLLNRVVPSKPTFSARESFDTDLRDWQGSLDSFKPDWQRVGTAIRVGQLRLWKPTIPLADYNMDFEARIERNALAWAFRASDHSTYYATKISLARGGRAEIIRWTQLQGQSSAKVTLPIPIRLNRDNTYEVKVRVSGNRFSTLVDGQLVDSWSDNRLRRGGVGFFSDAGDSAAIRWVAVTEREDFLQRFLSFSFLINPAMFPVE